MKVIATCARYGVTATKVGTLTLRTDTGVHLGLSNLVDRCLNAPRKYWDAYVEAHVTTMMESQRLGNPDYLLGLPDDEFYMRLRERVAPLDILRATRGLDYSRPFVDTPDSPRRVLNLSFPDLAMTLTDDLLSNRDLDAAWAFGRQHTAAMKFEEHQSLVKDDVTLGVWRGDSIYLASKVADMPTLIADHLGEAPNGVLFAIPNAYEIDYYLPLELTDTARATTMLLGLAKLLTTGTPNPLSGEVYFWRDGEYSQVSDGNDVSRHGLYADMLLDLPDRG